MSADWQVNIEDEEDARRFSRIGGYVGFAYAILSAILFFFTAYLNRDDYTQMGAEQLFSVFVIAVLHLIVFSFLAWRVHSGRGFISSIVMLGLFLMFKFTNPSLLSMSLQGIVVSGIIAYTMYAGIRGNWALRKFRKEPDISAFD